MLGWIITGAILFGIVELAAPAARKRAGVDRFVSRTIFDSAHPDFAWPSVSQGRRTAESLLLRRPHAEVFSTCGSTYKSAAPATILSGS